MTDKESLFTYRIKQAEETLSDAEKMLKNKLGPRSIINRAYYTMFYAVLALFLISDTSVKTSKHSGIISLFDKEFVRAQKFDVYYSKIFHKTFDIRQESDYKEFAVLSHKDASEYIALAKKFLKAVTLYTRKIKKQYLKKTAY